MASALDLVLRKRPAETGGAAGALAILLAHLLGVEDAEVIVALAVVLGWLPAAITWAVERFAER